MASQGNRIKQLREQRNWEQSDLARELGVGQATVSNWESKNSGIKSGDLAKLAKVFNVSTDYILLGNEQKVISKQEQQEVPNSIYKDLVEANSDYRLVPKTILQEEYRIVLKSEIDQKQKLYLDVIEAKNKLISKLENDISILQGSLKKI